MPITQIRRGPEPVLSLGGTVFWAAALPPSVRKGFAFTVGEQKLFGEALPRHYGRDARDPSSSLKLLFEAFELFAQFSEFRLKSFDFALEL
jgi:hypothetical protein